jgi:hypothetical protein
LRAQGRGAPGRKKLKEAACAWATGGAPLDENNTLEALKKFNATEQQLEEARAALAERRRSEVFEVWPENWRAFELFAAAPWQRSVVAGLAGGKVLYFNLDWPALGDIEERWLPPDGDECEEPAPLRRALFHQLKMLEGEALLHLNA